MSIHPSLIKKLLQIQQFFNEQWATIPLFSYQAQDSLVKPHGNLADLIEDDEDDGDSYYGSGGTARGNRGDNTKRAQRRSKTSR